MQQAQVMHHCIELAWHGASLAKVARRQQPVQTCHQRMRLTQSQVSTE